jgi:hypothetical protein
MYSHLPYFLYIAAMLCCEIPGQLPVARWCPFRCLVLSGLVISFVIRYDIIKTLVFCAYILVICMTTWSWAYVWWASGFGLKTGCDNNQAQGVPRSKGRIQDAEQVCHSFYTTFLLCSQWCGYWWEEVIVFPQWFGWWTFLWFGSTRLREFLDHDRQGPCARE